MGCVDAQGRPEIVMSAAIKNSKAQFRSVTIGEFTDGEGQPTAGADQEGTDGA